MSTTSLLGTNLARRVSVVGVTSQLRVDLVLDRLVLLEVVLKGLVQAERLEQRGELLDHARLRVRRGSLIGTARARASAARAGRVSPWPSSPLLAIGP